jgi:predicted CXXCH cytochrome family protein
LQDFHLIYGFTNAGQGMAVTGHVEQLHQSKCYQKSQNLTCTTCHDPHGFPQPDRRVDYYRAACLNCHAETACKVDRAKRQKESPENSCVKCHMAAGTTDVPHLAFNNHRIGIHSGSGSFQRTLPPVDLSGRREALQAFHDLSHYSALDQKRALGLAYAKAGAHQEIAQAVRPFNQRAQRLLSEVWEAGIRDGPVSCALARTNYWLGRTDLRAYAESALNDADLDAEDRCDMLFLVADSDFHQRKYAEAAERLRQITRLRRNAIDWSYLSKCERAAGDRDEALKCLETAAKIGTTNARLQRDLADLYDQLGNREKADWFRRIGQAPANKSGASNP